MRNKRLGLSRKTISHWKAVAYGTAQLTEYVTAQIKESADTLTRIRAGADSAYAPLGKAMAVYVEEQQLDLEAGLDLKALVEASPEVEEKVQQLFRAHRRGVEFAEGAVAQQELSHKLLMESLSDPEYFLTLKGTAVDKVVSKLIKATGATGFDALYAYNDEAPAGITQKVAQIATEADGRLYEDQLGATGLAMMKWLHAQAYAAVRLKAALEATAETSSNKKAKVSRRFRKVYQRTLRGHEAKMPAALRKEYDRVMAEAKAHAEEQERAAALRARGNIEVTAPTCKGE